MFQLDKKKKNIVSLTLRIIVSGYIGFMGGMLVKGYMDENNPWYLGFGIFFMVMAVAFVVFGFWYYFRMKSIDAEMAEQQVEGEATGEDADKGDAPAQTGSPDGSANQEKRVRISDIANYKSED